MAIQIDSSRYYAELKLSPGATLADVKAAFRRLSKERHPDQFAADPDQYKVAMEQQTRLNEAYSFLTADLRDRPAGSHADTAPATQSAASTSVAASNIDLEAPTCKSGGASIQQTIIQELVDQGRRHETGNGAPADLQSAVNCYKQASRMGSASANFRLGCIFLDSIYSDPKMAADYFGRAAESGHVSAMFNLALMCERGQGIPIDTMRAVELYTRGAEKGDQQCRQQLQKVYGRAGVKGPAASGQPSGEHRIPASSISRSYSGQPGQRSGGQRFHWASQGR